MKISLTPPEMIVAAMIGARRQVESIIKKRKNAHGFDGSDGWTKHIEGAAGEMAFSKATNKYWGFTVGTFKEADVGENIQVRTRSRGDYDLLVRDADRDDHIFVHVTGAMPHFEIHGWLWGKEAKQEKYLKEHGGRPPAYFIPASDLRTAINEITPGVDIAPDVTP